MSQLVIDYSWARPGAAAIKAAGYVGVMRYLSNDTSGKNLTVDEANDLHTNGLSIGLIWEGSPSAALNGGPQGTTDAGTALSQANALGQSSDRPIYFAVDTPVADADLVKIDAYLESAAGVIGQGRVGVYGDDKVVTHCAANGIKWLMQTTAWISGAVDASANLFQNGQSAFNGGADIDIVQQADWGGWLSTTTTTASSTNPVPVQTIPNPNPAQAAGSGGTYVTVSGDTLIKIGTKLNIDWRAIASLNHLAAPYEIGVNERLVLPGGSQNAAPVQTSGRYTVIKGDTGLIEIGSKLGVSWQSIANANNIAAPKYEIYVGQVLVIPGTGAAAPAAKTYRVQQNDNLSNIGARLGINWKTIAAKNNIAAPKYEIYTNELLQLP